MAGIRGSHLTPPRRCRWLRRPHFARPAWQQPSRQPAPHRRLAVPQHPPTGPSTTLRCHYFGRRRPGPPPRGRQRPLKGCFGRLPGEGLSGQSPGDFRHLPQQARQHRLVRQERAPRQYRLVRTKLLQEHALHNQLVQQEVLFPEVLPDRTAVACAAATTPA